MPLDVVAVSAAAPKNNVNAPVSLSSVQILHVLRVSA